LNNPIIQLKGTYIKIGEIRAYHYSFDDTVKTIWLHMLKQKQPLLLFYNSKKQFECERDILITAIREYKNRMLHNERIIE